MSTAVDPIADPAEARGLRFTWTWPRGILAALATAGLAATVYRFIFGLGAATNLSDQWPWALWISLNVLSGVALSAGAFTMAAAVHLFRQKALEPLLRPAILMGFLGYLQVIGGLIVELGKPWNIWHPIVMWQPRSAMFEVAWCVMLYTVVLALEFGPALFERLRARRVLAFLQKISPGVVVAGVVLSTLHQSSLGTFFVLVPGKLHPLWNSMLLPVFFFTSAVTLAVGVLALLAVLAGRYLIHRDLSPVAARLLRALPWLVALYLAMKLADLAYRGHLGALFTGDLNGFLFWLELILLVVPAHLALFPSLRARGRAQAWLGGMVVAGVVLNRFNVSFFGMREYVGVPYLPSLTELAISLGLISLAIFAFIFIAENLPVFQDAGVSERVKAASRREPVSLAGRN